MSDKQFLAHFNFTLSEYAKRTEKLEEINERLQAEKLKIFERLNRSWEKHAELQMNKDETLKELNENKQLLQSHNTEFEAIRWKLEKNAMEKKVLRNRIDQLRRLHDRFEYDTSKGLHGLPSKHKG